MAMDLQAVVDAQSSRIAELEREIRHKDRTIGHLRIDVERERLFAATKASGKAALGASQRVADRYLRLLLSNGPNVVICFDRFARVEFHSAAFSTLLASLCGGARVQAEGRPLCEAMECARDRAFVESMRDNLERVLSSNESLSFTAQARVEDPEDPSLVVVRKLIANFVPMVSGNDENDGALAVMQDVTEIEAARVEAEKASLAKSQFLSNMSHEMRTPLNAITGMVAIASKALGARRRDHCLCRIGAAASRMLALVDDVLDMCKIDAGAMELSIADADFAAVLEGAAKSAKAQMDEKRQEFRTSVDSAIPRCLRIDSKRLAQVAYNLLSNASKFTPAGGRISLDARLELLDIDSCVALVAVRDNGIGVSEEIREVLFSPFLQESSGDSRKFGGLGLGLALVKRLAGMMGGRAWLEPEPGGGSAFFFTFRAEIGDAGALERGSAAEGAAGASDFSSFRALLVDDVELNREIVMALLEHTGIAIDCAGNGVEAVEKFRKASEPYDIVFMDIQMPEMDGYEAARAMREIEDERAACGLARGHVPIVALTAKVFREDVDKCLESGMDNHVAKPVTTDGVMEMLHMYLGNWSPLC